MNPFAASRTGRTGLRLLLFGAALALLAAVALAWLGYWDQQVLVFYPARGAQRPEDRGLAAVIVSGDMGLKAGMGQSTALEYARHGIPAIGLNSLAYFRHPRSQKDVAALLAKSILTVLSRSGADRVVLIGQSYGADMVHYGLARLDPRLRGRIALVALVSPTRTIYRQVSPAEMFELSSPDADPLATAKLLGWARVACIRGREDAETLCPLLRLPGLRQVIMPGGHLLHRDSPGLFAAIQGAFAPSDRTNR